MEAFGSKNKNIKKTTNFYKKCLTLFKKNGNIVNVLSNV